MQLLATSLWAVVAATFAALLLAAELGRWVGKLAHRPRPDNVATVEGAILGLLALIIGFTFALGLSRFDAKREAVLVEANAIGTAALRAQLLPPPQDAEALKLFDAYVQLRLDPRLTSSAVTLAEVAEVVERSNATQSALWDLARQVAQGNDSMVPTGLFIQSLNDMFDSQEARLLAVASAVPAVVLVALNAIAVVASFFVGYAAGLQQQASRVPSYIMISLVAVVLWLIYDLDRPRQGFIKTDLQPLENVANAISAALRR